MTRTPPLRTASLLTLAGLALAGPAASAAEPDARMLRHPDVSATHVVFVYANDVWTVPREGGVASPLSSPAGQEMFPRFAPDGQTIAFMGNYDGNTDLYTVPLAGGKPHRVTHHPSWEILCDWTSAGDLLFFANGTAPLQRQMQLLRVAPEGGLPEKLPVPYGANGSIHADGRRLVYTPHSRDHRTWKRYRGGQATDIWLFDLVDRTSQKITDWEGTDSQPMWHGDTVYHLSDAGPAHRMNVWAYDAASGERRQVTFFAEFDAKWPAMGPGPDGGGEIVFQMGSGLHLLDLPTGKTRRLAVSVPGDRPHLRPRKVDASEQIQSWGISPSGKRAVLGARGDIWTVPAKHGVARNLTRTSGVAERDPAWSPDGKWITYLADTTGEYELHLVGSNGDGKPRQLTRDGTSFRYRPEWSPDSKFIAFCDKTGGMFLHAVESGETHQFDTDPWSDQPRMSWSHDSSWIAYSRAGSGSLSVICLYDVPGKQVHEVTSGMTKDHAPAFDREGSYLYYASGRDYSRPRYAEIGDSFAYVDTDVLLVVPLTLDEPSPFAPEVDEETWEEEPEGEAADSEDASEDEEPKEAEPDAKEPERLRIDLAGFERRGIRLPVEQGSFSNLAVADGGKLLYTRHKGWRDSSVRMIDVSDDDPSEKTVVGEAGAFRLSADGKQLIVRKNRRIAIVEPKPGQDLGSALDLSGLTVEIEPRAEWRQMFHEAWRLHRDFFYVENLHGVDWDAMRERYGAMLDDCVSREDLSFVISELVSELNVGHAYYRGGDGESAPSVNVGMLGVDFEKGDGGYQIARILEGAPWDDDARGPLAQPGVDVKVGDYVLAVEGRRLTLDRDPWAAFQGLAGKTVTLTVGRTATATGEDVRTVVVQLLGDEAGLRYRAWVEERRRRVAERSDGRVAYLHVPNTGRRGQNELFRQFHGRMRADALIVDERWNGGGQIPTRFVELLNRPVQNHWARRDGKDWTTPHDAHHGPKCMLVNGLSGSGGDAFPAYFRHAGLGPLVGTRTWGGLVGYTGTPNLIDGGVVIVPTFGYYEQDGTWGIEGHGVDPDHEVIDDPALMQDGGDPQLDRAIELMLAALETAPYRRPDRPVPPDRSGMGIEEADK